MESVARVRTAREVKGVVWSVGLVSLRVFGCLLKYFLFFAYVAWFAVFQFYAVCPRAGLSEKY